MGVYWESDTPTAHSAFDQNLFPRKHIIARWTVYLAYTHTLIQQAYHRFTLLQASISPMAYYSNSRSPPPLQHPVPTHPAYIPEPPSTPASPQGYERYTSSPAPPIPQQQPSVYTQAMPSMSRAPQPPYGSYSHIGSPPQPSSNIRGPAPPAPPVDFSAWGLNDATAQFGMQLGQSAVAAGQDYVQKNVSVYTSSTSFK